MEYRLVRLLHEEGEEYATLLERFRALSSTSEAKVSFDLCIISYISPCLGRRKCPTGETVIRERIHPLPS